MSLHSIAIAVPAAVLGVFTMAACSSSGGGAVPAAPTTSIAVPAPSAAASSTSATSAPPVASGAGADACKLVTAAMLKSTIHLDAGAPMPKPSSTGGSSCDFQARTGLLDGTAIVQTSSQPDLYFPDSVYASSQDAVKVTAPGVDRGWVTAQPTGGTVLVVKNKVGVMVNYNVPHANLSAADAQKLAAALAKGL